MPSFPAPETREFVRAALQRSDYTEPAICQLFGVATTSEALALADVVLARKATPRSALTVLLRLFFQGGSVDIGEATATLGAAETSALEASGLIVAEAGAFRASVQLVPVGSLVIASDRPSRHLAACSDFVVGPAPVSRVLAEFMIRRPVERTLDLGCGSGVLGLRAAAHSRHVVATDINPRAVAIAEFNAQLNGLDHVRAVSGDLFSGVAGERFDLIICNPPFVISPQAEFVYRDGGLDICRRIVREVADHLQPDGFLQMLCNWPEAGEQEWQAECASWFEDNACDAWVLRMQSYPRAAYASIWLSQQYRGQSMPAGAFDVWMTHLESLGARSVGGGLVVMRPARGRKPWLEIRDAPPSLGAAGDSIVRAFVARDAMARLGSDAEFLDRIWRPSPNLQQTSVRGLAATGWGAPVVELRAGDGFAFVARVDPVAAELVSLMDGRMSLREVVHAWAEARGMPAEMFVEHLPEAMRKLLALGLLEPVAAESAG